MRAKPFHSLPGTRSAQGAISNFGGLSSLRQSVFGAVGVSKKEAVMDWAHFDVAKTTWGS